MEPSSVAFFFKRPEEIPSETLEKIRLFIEEGSGVGSSWVRENLRNAFLIGYAEHGGEVVGKSNHKYPRKDYRLRIEAATGLDLSGYLERGYTAVRGGTAAQGSEGG